MKTTKIFLMAALALTFAACSNDDNDIQTTPQPAKAEGITITATLAPKSSAGTRAVEEGKDGDNKDIIKATWAKNEHIAILYTVGSEKKVADAEITSVDGTTGVATITFGVDGSTVDGTACQIVYPYSAAKDDKSDVKDAATLLASQDGTLSANLDVRVGAGKIKTSTPSLTVTTEPTAQFAIFKFDVKNADATASINVKPLTITIGAQNYVITPADAKSTLYAALPAVSGQAVSFSATGSDSKTYTFSKDGVTFAAGKYYASTLKMTPAAPEYYNKLTKINDNFSDQVYLLKQLGRGRQAYNSSLTAAQAYALATYQASIDGRPVYVIMSSLDNGYEIHYAVSTDASATEHTAGLYDLCSESNTVRMYYVAQ